MEVKPDLNTPYKESVVMYQKSIKAETFKEITKSQGAYDVMASSQGDPNFIDRDQVGFRYGDLNFDVAYQSEREVYELAVQKDRVHLYLNSPPKWSPSQVARLIKGGTGNKIRKLYPNPDEVY